jgi:hypothetical protein
MRSLSESLSRIVNLIGGSRWLGGLGHSSGLKSRQRGSRWMGSCSKADSSRQRYTTRTGMKRERKTVAEEFGLSADPVVRQVGSKPEYNNFGGAVDCTGCQQDHSGCRSGSCTGP